MSACVPSSLAICNECYSLRFLGDDLPSVRFQEKRERWVKGNRDRCRQSKRALNFRRCSLYGGLESLPGLIIQSTRSGAGVDHAERALDGAF